MRFSMKIYTKKGDFGKTSLCDGSKQSKSSVRIRALGAVDETNSAIGLAIALCNETFLKKFLEKIQKELFVVGGEIALAKNCRISGKNVLLLEKEIDKINEKLPELKEFILPNGCNGASALHLARSICRRAESELAGLNEMEKINPEILKYFNRLGDLLFVLARFENKMQKQKKH